MIPNIHQSIEDILKKASSAELITWQQLRLLTGENCAIRQLYFQGLIPAEYTTYTAGTLFYALELQLGVNSFISDASGAFTLQTFDELNNQSLVGQNISSFWNTTGAVPNIFGLNFNLTNLYFSRLLLSGYATMKFIGYKLTF